MNKMEHIGHKIVLEFNLYAFDLLWTFYQYSQTFSIFGEENHFQYNEIINIVNEFVEEIKNNNNKTEKWLRWAEKKELNKY